MSSVENSRKDVRALRRSSESALSTPGPAAYYIPRDLCNRSISFTRASKSPCNLRMSPGPGSYNITSELGSGPKAVIPRGRSSIGHELFPGPSDYSPIYSTKSIGYSFAKKKKEIAQPEVTPGPGDYEILNKSYAPRTVIGRARRILLEEIGGECVFKGLKERNSGGNTGSHALKKQLCYSFDRSRNTSSFITRNHSPFIVTAKVENENKAERKKGTCSNLPKSFLRKKRRDETTGNKSKENSKPMRALSVKKPRKN